MNPLVLHIPHASTAFPAAYEADFLPSPAVLRQELLRLTDWYADELFAAGAPADQSIRAGWSRLVVDVERFPDDSRERCAEYGMGATYVRTSRGEALRELTPARREEIMQLFYWPHHARLNLAARQRLERFEHCLIIDAHTFPSLALPTQVDFAAPPEIGLGTEGMHTSAELLALAERFFRAHGLSVGVDTPFAGTMVPNDYFGKQSRVQSIMVEVRRDLYLHEATGEKHAGFTAMQRLLSEFRLLAEGFASRGKSSV